jgi:DNA-binding response OmpR family regulator
VRRPALQELLELVRQQDWDVAVLDLSLGRRSGLEILKQIRPHLLC